MLHIGPYQLSSRVVLAPMAGISDRPFRTLCRHYGAALAATEMLSANPQLRDTRGSLRRRVHRDEAEPRVVQIAGADPVTLAGAARQNVEEGAQIIDINMGCPVKKVLKQAAGSALLRDEALVATLLRAVVAAVNVPVTLKIRTGWSPELRNGLAIARIAEDCGVAALAVHGRTRACMFNGAAEYDTIAAIKQAVRIPVFANGDITDAVKAATVLSQTGADGVMIGRAARGQPWLFRDIDHYLRTGFHLPATPPAVIHKVLRQHAQALHAFYAGPQALGYVRKHAAWYLAMLPGAREFRSHFNALDSAAAQLEQLDAFFDSLAESQADQEIAA